jgi:hypothetical protein
MTPHYIARHPLTAFRELGGEMIVISARDSRLFTLNDVAATIWKAADGMTTLQEIVNGIVCAEYEVEPSSAAGDVERFVDDLVEQGILVRSDRPIAPEGGAA